MRNDYKALEQVFLTLSRIDLATRECHLLSTQFEGGYPAGTVSSFDEMCDYIKSFMKSPAEEKRLQEYIDLDTIVERISSRPYLKETFEVKDIGWCRMSFIAEREDGSDEITSLLLCLRGVDAEVNASLKAKKDLERSNRVLKDALAAAHHANQAKTTFLNSMSHDIRTPMNAIIGFTSLAASHIDNKDAVIDYLKKITVSSNHLLSLINDVLDMSRIESGRTKLEEQEVSLAEILHDIRSIIHSNILAKQLDFFVDTQDVIHEKVMVDKLRLNQVLLNILGNAVKFTPSGGTVSLRVIENPCPSPEYAEYEFRIKDTGIGMSPEYQKHIFEPFSREQTTTVSGIQGSGLGMAITKNIVTMMNGAIAVNSEVGKGTEFTVIIDLKKASDAVSQESIPELKGMHALVADDDFNTCSSVSKMLTTIGMRPEWTTSGKEAVLRTKYAKESGDEFRAFIIDWLMPDMNGIEVVRRIRSEIGEDTPIIILTAYDWTGIEEEAREAGVTGFCAKPLFLSELRDVLSRPFRKVAEPETAPEQPNNFNIFEGKRILLAEDNIINQELAEAILTEFGFSLDIASDGTEALQFMEEHEADYYDVVITDIQMPLMDGYELSRSIRALPDSRKADIPIFAMTANAFEEDKRLALAAKMNGHLSKPINIPELITTLECALVNRKTENSKNR